MIIRSPEQLLSLVADKHIPLATDSRQVRPGGIFAALPAPVRPHSGVRDGAEFIAQALLAGAGYIVCSPATAAALMADDTMARNDVAVVASDDAHALLGRLAAVYHGTDNGPDLFAVTGTNGKTTVSYLLEHLFNAAHKPCGVFGTVSYRWPGHCEAAPLTTPGMLDIHERLARMRKAGTSHCVLEASSHALDQKRLAGLSFKGAVFTNLTQDHLDYHGDMEDYFAAKARLFTTVPGFDKAAAINGDDAFGRRLLAALPAPVGFGLCPAPEGLRGGYVHGTVVSHSTEGLHLQMRFDGMQWELRSPLVGLFNASNLLAAQALGLAAGLPVDALRALENFPGVPGRLERVSNPRGLHVFVDYAHTPDALINVLSSLRGAGFKRIVAVFGCGGDRDRGKRPLMGQAVVEHADVAVLTSDNPRSEEPLAIMADVLPGLAQAKELYQEADRKNAIKLALELLGAHDALVVAGKGHEDYQIIKGVKHHFSDQETIQELLA